MPEVQKIQWRRGTAAAWTAANPVLSEGTPGFETDTNKFKVGDGVKDWKTLAYKGDVTLTGTQALSNKTLVSPTITNPTINDAFGQKIVSFPSMSAARSNFMSFINSDTNPVIDMNYSPAGSNVGLTIAPKGTGSVTIYCGAGVTPTIVGKNLSSNTNLDLRSTGTGTVTINGDPALHVVAVPASATASGAPGDVAFDTGFMYVCTATNKWLRAPLATW